MKRQIIASTASAPVELYVEFEPYERYDKQPIKKAKIKRASLREALAAMADNMSIYVEPDSIMSEDAFPTEQDIINDIQYSNGDGCDFIYLLKNLTDGTVYIDEGLTDDEVEEW